VKYAFLSILAICLTVIYVTWRVERMQAKRTMAALQVVQWRGQ
jgi:hypothetical protein